MVDQSERTPDRDWKVIFEIGTFIRDSDTTGGLKRTINDYCWNFFGHLEKLYRLNQIIVQRNKAGQLVAVCGYIRVTKEEEDQINKVAWRFPKNLSEGNQLYVSFCVIKAGNLLAIRREMRQRVGLEIDEIFWFSVPNNKYVRHKNMAKGVKHGASH